MLFDMRCLLDQMSGFILHAHREANSVADGLVRLASSAAFSQYFTLFTLPRKVRGLVILDSQSVPCVRTV